MSAEAQKQATRRVVIVAARDEADRIGDTVHTLREAMPGIEVWVADDASTDGTRDAAMAAGATVVRRNRPHGKGGNMTAAATAALDDLPDAATVLLCDGDLGASAANLVPLLEAVEDGSADLTIAGFERRWEGVSASPRATRAGRSRHLCGYENSPISGQRAMSAATPTRSCPSRRATGWRSG
ncbi:MAG: glycosyltransferase [Solirubrobacterales bacterium]